MRALLTKRLVATSQPQERPYEIRDTQVRGLLLRVQPSGHRAWIIEWARGKRRTLGAMGHLTLDQARAHASQAMAEHIQQGLPSIAKKERARCSLEAFLSDRYEPWARIELKGGDRYVERIRTVFSSMLMKSLNDLTPSWVDRWWAARLAETTRTGAAVTKATATRDLACLRSALSKAAQWGIIERNPLLDLRLKAGESRKVVRFLTKLEETRLRKALTQRDQQLAAARDSGNEWRLARGVATLPEVPASGYADHVTPLVLLALNTGLRRGELLSLCWKDVDLPSRMLTVRAEHAKSGRQRHVPMNDEAFRVLTQWLQQSDEGVGRLFAVRDVKTAWGGVLASAKISDFRFHDLRHHFASRLVMAGVDLNTVRELLGHSDISMTLRYAHLGPDHLAAAVAKLT